TVHINGTEVEVTKHEFDLLYYLMAHPNVVFTREQLVQELYPHNQQQILDRTIDAHIKKIREKVEATPSKPKRIMTKRGIGYMFSLAYYLSKLSGDYHCNYCKWLGDLSHGMFFSGRNGELYRCRARTI